MRPGTAAGATAGHEVSSDWSKQEKASFETILTELDGLVQNLESGDLSLEDSLATFERGMTLANQGGTLLDEAERKVEVLLNPESGDTTRVPLDPAEME